MVPNPVVGSAVGYGDMSGLLEVKGRSSKFTDEILVGTLTDHDLLFNTYMGHRTGLHPPCS